MILNIKSAVQQVIEILMFSYKFLEILNYYSQNTLSWRENHWFYVIFM